MWAQAVLLATSAALAAWVSLDAAFDAIGGRAATLGPGGPAGRRSGRTAAVGGRVAMAAQQPGANRLPGANSCRTTDESRRHDCPGRAPLALALRQNASLAAGVLLLCCSGCGKSRSDRAGTPSRRRTWLHRSIISMLAARSVRCSCWAEFWAGMDAAEERAIGSPPAGDWRPWVLGGLSGLPGLGGRARAGTDALPPGDTRPPRRRGVAGAMRSPWIAPWAVAVVAAAMVGLVAGCLACAWCPVGIRCD